MEEESEGGEGEEADMAAVQLKEEENFKKTAAQMKEIVGNTPGPSLADLSERYFLLLSFL